MRKLLFLSLILLNFSVFAEDSTLKAIKDTSEVTFSKVYNDVKTGISAVATALKVGAEHVYEVLVLQQVVNAVVFIIILLMSIVLCVNFIKKSKDTNEIWFDGTDPTILGVVRTIQLIAGIIMFGVGIFHLDIIATGLINPEYGALQEIMSWIK